MRFTIPYLGLDLLLQDDVITSVVIEAPELFSRTVGDIWNQSMGGEGECLLAENGKNIKLSSRTVCIVNPFNTNVNDRRIIGRLYKELNNLSYECVQKETAELHAAVLRYLDSLTNCSSYALTYDEDIDLVALMKDFNLRINTLDDSLLEQIIDYIRASHQICDVTVIFTVNLKLYLSETEMNQLCEFAIYEKVYLVDIGNVNQYSLQKEKTWIIDKDRCIIDLN